MDTERSCVDLVPSERIIVRKSCTYDFRGNRELHWFGYHMISSYVLSAFYVMSWFEDVYHIV